MPRDTFYEQIGRRITQLREEAGWTQRQLARAIDYDYAGVSKLERGKRKISLETLRKVARALHVQWSRFIDIKDTVTVSQPVANIGDVKKPRLTTKAEELLLEKFRRLSVRERVLADSIIDVLLDQRAGRVDGLLEQLSSDAVTVPKPETVTRLKKYPRST